MAILTVEQFRSLSASSLEDSALQILLDAAEEAIVAFAGAPASALELLDGGNRFVSLARPATSISSITETSPWGATVTTLAADDYLLYPNGATILRLSGGTNSRWRWYGRVAVTYVPVDDTSERQRVQRALVDLDLNYAPGTTSEQIGAWMEQRSQQSNQWNYTQERDAILASLASSYRPAMVVV